jgi:hypothetical protein
VITILDATFGTTSRNRLSEAAQYGIAGAQAALETFYFTLNQNDAVTLRRIWLDDPLVQLNNPLGGMIRGVDPIVRLYERIFSSGIGLRVQFSDIVQYNFGNVTVFAGRERAQYHDGSGELVAVDIRTSRIFIFSQHDEGWRQIHHHGSIDDVDALTAYREAVAAAARSSRNEQ